MQIKYYVCVIIRIGPHERDDNIKVNDYGRRGVKYACWIPWGRVCPNEEMTFR
jgi:hypothetical protein